MVVMYFFNLPTTNNISYPKRSEMIQAKDLRIGNLVNYSEDGSLCEVLAIDRLGLSVNVIKTQEITWVELDQFEPLPLTPDILEKCGFNWNIYHQAYHKENFEFNLRTSYPTGYTLTTFKKVVVIAPNIQHLHQLQNLYYALTGEELTYNQ